VIDNLQPLEEMGELLSLIRAHHDADW
jgi:hypothetical protein